MPTTKMLQSPQLDTRETAIPLTINTFSDLVHIVETRPKWRRKLVKVLFPEVDLPKALQELAKAQKRMQALLEKLNANYEQLDTKVTQLDTKVTQLDTKVTQLDTKVTQLDARVERLETDMKDVKHTVKDLKGKSHENNYLSKAVSIFGRYLKRGHRVTNDVADQLHEAEERGDISAQEFTRVLAADLLWGGRLRRTTSEVVLVVEASWLAEVSDVKRATERASTLRKIGLQALPVVAGHEWTEAATELAHGLQVVMTTNGTVDDQTWENALQAHFTTALSAG